MNIIHHRSDGMGLKEIYNGDRLNESDLVICPHCNKSFTISAAEDTYVCKRHMKPVCKSCSSKPCIDFLKILDDYEIGKIKVLL